VVVQRLLSWTHAGFSRFANAYLVRLGAKGAVEWVEQDGDGKATAAHEDEPETSWLIKLKNWMFSPFVREELLQAPLCVAPRSARGHRQWPPTAGQW